MRIGDILVQPIFDGELRMGPADVYPDIDESRWPQDPGILGDDGMVEMLLGGYVIQTGDRTVLVDVGIGPAPKAPFTGGHFLESLRAVGVVPDQVTDVVFTHLHFDHIGWATQNGEITFPNATYRCHAADWDFFVVNSQVQEWEARVSHPEDAPSVRLAPVEHRMELWDQDAPILPGVDVVPFPGHTPGSTAIVVSSGEERGMLIGDIAHCPVELLDDDWHGVGDVDLEKARYARNELAHQLAAGGIPVAGAHFPGFRWGKLQSLQDKKKRRWVVMGVS